MRTHLRAAVVALLAMTLLCGVAYPLTVWAGAMLLAPDAARGQLVERDGAVVGSRLIGQAVTSERYLHGRPSAVDHATGGAGSGGSNLGPTSAELAEVVAGRRAAVAAREGVAPESVPVDLVTSSASGLDPDISPAAAAIQVPRIARVRGLSREAVRRVVEDNTHRPVLGLGATRVRVLEVNLGLDALADGRG